MNKSFVEKLKEKDFIKRSIIVLIWGIAIVFLLKNRSKITVDSFVAILPENIFLSSIMILLAFGVKSVTVVFPCWVIITAIGVLYNFGYSLFLGLLGTIIVVSLPYLIGYKYGKDGTERVLNKYPKLRKVESVVSNNPFIHVLLLRICGLFPSDPLSFYLGSQRIGYVPYLLASVLSFVFVIITYISFGFFLKTKINKYLYMMMISEIIKYSVSVITIIIKAKKIFKKKQVIEDQ